MRAVIPGLIKDEELLQSIEPGLEQYPAGSVEFILGAATALDKDAKTVEMSTASGSRSVGYDFLVLATGARAADTSLPWKASGTYEECLESLHRTAERIGKASHIVVAGAGATGVELAAEIRAEFKDKKTVVLLSADQELVGGDSTAGAVERELVKLGVQIKKSVRSDGVETLEDGKTQVSLSTGEKLVTDLYLPTMGLVPNTEFLPSECLTERKYVDVDDRFRVKTIEDAWALGDAVSKPRASYPETEAQVSCRQIVKCSEQTLADVLPGHQCC